MNHAHDFKTLADVLIQETVRHDLGRCYPNLADHILVRNVSIIDYYGFYTKVQKCETYKSAKAVV